MIRAMTREKLPYILSNLRSKTANG
jgi:hypothetical protein